MNSAVAEASRHLTSPCTCRALAFQKEGHHVVKLARIMKRSMPVSWRVLTPQLMGRAVKGATSG